MPESNAIDTEALNQSAALLRAARKIVVLTGAGISKESGIPTFRDALTGLWSNYDAEKLATVEGFLADPPLVWQWYDHRRKMVAECKPNPGHFALAKLSAKKRVHVVTQNVDGLHQKAGSDPVIELHGNIMQFFCFDNRHPVDNVPLGLKEPPACPVCQSQVRPAVVWFGEALPPRALRSASDLAGEADVMMVVGTSGIVQPAASLPLIAARSQAKIIEINPETTPITDTADIFLGGMSGKVLPQLISILEENG